jgi:hypothetical protein
MAMEGSDDVYVHKFTISLGGKTLFSDSRLSLARGRRYGLIGARLRSLPRIPRLARTPARTPSLETCCVRRCRPQRLR